MIIEALYPELCNLYGDMANLRYLAACRPQAQIIQTQFQQTPAFCREPVDLLYLGAMPEDSQAMALRRLAPYAAALRDRIEGGMAVLATGNALELFGQGIAGPDGGTPEKPVGLVYVGVASASGCETQEMHLRGERDWIHELTCVNALNALRLTLG